MKIVAIIMTLNEELHLERCIISLKSFVSQIVIADCFSTDSTLEIARAHGARLIQHQWVNHAIQFNWALTQLDADTDWVLRIDADEYLTPELAEQIKGCIRSVGPEIVGIYTGRRMTFQGRLIRHGGVFPIRLLRLFRYGKGECENRWMDEHIKVNGPTLDLQGEIIDDNLSPLTWWIDKHNKYASREAIELLNLQYHFMPRDSVYRLRSSNNVEVKRWIKEVIYARLPVGWRAFAYFFYRYVIRLGFLDGYEGTAFHFLQGFWYRYLVDAKVAEVKRHMRSYDVGIKVAINNVLGVKL